MDCFHPKIWPEDAVPKSNKDCKDCGLYVQGTRMVWGEGNAEGRIMIILDNPGARENRDGNPYVCGTRQTLQQAIEEVGLAEDDIYITYILKRRPIRKYDKQQTRHICMQHLEQQLHMYQPSYIICLGNIAVQSFFKDSEATVKELRGNFYLIRGFQTTVAYHPLAVRRRPNLYRLFMEDLTLLAKQLYSGK